MSRFTPLALAVASATTLLSPAQADDTQIEEIIVVSSRVAMPLRQIGTSVSIVTADEIQARGFNSLYEVLRTQPAIGVSNSGGTGATTSLRVRGEEGFRTKLYIDGIDVSDTSSPQTSPRFESLLSAGINRVEVLRGPQGMMYGADAGGVINAYTRSAEPGLDGSVSAEAGRYGTRQFGADVAGGSDAIDFSLSATDFATDGFNARDSDTDLRDDDGAENTTLHGRLGWNVSDEFRLEAVVRDVDTDNDYDGCYDASFAPTNDCNNRFEQSAWRLAAELSTGRLQHELSYNNSDTERSDFAAGDFSYASEGELEQYGYLGSFRIDDSTRLVYGAERKDESLDSAYNQHQRQQDGYYLEYQGHVGDGLFITAGLRYDDNEDFGSHTSYRASAAYLVPLRGGELKLKAAYGTGFRAPSLYEIDYNANAYDPDGVLSPLEEEQSEGYDLGLAWYGQDGLYLEANYFDQTVSDEIYFDLVAYVGYLQGNGDTDSSGIELIATAPLGMGLSLDGNYTYNDTERAPGGNRIRRPEHLANLGLRWKALDERLSLGLYVRGAYDAIDIDGSDLDDYEVVSFNASFDVLNSLELYGRIENLFDEDYQEVPGYNTSGAAAYAGIRYHF